MKILVDFKGWIGIGNGLMRLTSMQGAWHRCALRRRQRTRCSSSSSQSWKSHYPRWPPLPLMCFLGLGEPTGRDLQGWKGQGRLPCSVTAKLFEQRRDCLTRSGTLWWQCRAGRSAVSRLAGRYLQGRPSCFCPWALLLLGGTVLSRIRQWRLHWCFRLGRRSLAIVSDRVLIWSLSATLIFRNRQILVSLCLIASSLYLGTHHRHRCRWCVARQARARGGWSWSDWMPWKNFS